MDQEKMTLLEMKIIKLLQQNNVSLREAENLFMRLMFHMKDTREILDDAIPPYEKIRSRYKHGSRSVDHVE